MSTSTPTRSSHTRPVYTTALAWFCVAACVVGGVWVALTAASNEWPMLGPAILFVCALLIAAGVLEARRGTRGRTQSDPAPALW
jgi:quinol-cytochrome oxidoreductase complex cytochrome b subunit